jgi:hypothetical protein
MSKPLILVVMLIYAYVACEQAARGNWAGAVVWGAYAVANIGMWMLAT